MRWTDLTAPLSADLWRYSDAFPGFAAEPVASLQNDGYVVHRLVLGTHLGTHTDAGSHLLPGGWRLGDVDLDHYAGVARVARLGGLTPLTAVEARDLERTAPDLQHGEGIVIDTGWDRHFGQPGYAVQHPFLTPAAAGWLIDRGTRFVAADLPGLMDPRIKLAPPADSAGTTDGRLLTARTPYVVGLINVRALRGDRVWFVAFPLRIDGFDGAPVRAVAREL